jgi:hypothetical protein
MTATKVEIRDKVLRKLNLITLTETPSAAFASHVEAAVEGFHTRLEAQNLLRRLLTVVDYGDAAGLVKSKGNIKARFPVATSLIVLQGDETIADGVVVTAVVYDEVIDQTTITTDGTFVGGLNAIAITWTIDTVPDELVFGYVAMVAAELALDFGITGQKYLELQQHKQDGWTQLMRGIATPYDNSQTTKVDYF